MSKKERPDATNIGPLEKRQCNACPSSKTNLERKELNSYGQSDRRRSA